MWNVYNLYIMFNMSSIAFRFKLLPRFCLLKIFSSNGLWLCSLKISILVLIRLFNFAKHLLVLTMQYQCSITFIKNLWKWNLWPEINFNDSFFSLYILLLISLFITLIFKNLHMHSYRTVIGDLIWRVIVFVIICNVTRVKCIRYRTGYTLLIRVIIIYSHQ